MYWDNDKLEVDLTNPPLQLSKKECSPSPPYINVEWKGNTSMPFGEHWVKGEGENAKVIQCLRSLSFSHSFCSRLWFTKAVCKKERWKRDKLGRHTSRDIHSLGGCHKFLFFNIGYSPAKIASISWAEFKESNCSDNKCRTQPHLRHLWIFIFDCYHRVSISCRVYARETHLFSLPVS